MILAWPILIAGALLGWGLIAAAAARRFSGVDLGSAADALPLGVAVYLVLAGVALALDLHGPAFTTAMVVVGMGAVVVTAVRRIGARRPGRWDLGGLGVAAFLVGLVLAVALWRTAQFAWNACDDGVAYLYLARRLTAVGDLLDPMNNRRLTSFGGMSSLQAVFLDRLPDSALPLADLFIGPLLVLVQLWRTSIGRWSFWGIAGAIATTVLVANYKMLNTSPVLLPVGLTLAAFRFALELRVDGDAGAPARVPTEDRGAIGASPDAPEPDLATVGARGETDGAVATRPAERAHERPRSGARSALVLGGALGLVIAGAATLRPQFALALVPFALVIVVWPPVGRATLDRLGGLAIGGVVGLVGWAVASWRAVGTPMFPLLSGNLDPTWPANGPDVAGPSVTELVGGLADALTSPWIAVGILAGGAVLVGLNRLVGGGGHDRDVARWAVRTYVAAAGASVLLMAILGVLWWNVGSISSFPRFWAPVVVATVLFPLAALNATTTVARWRFLLEPAAFGAALLVLATGAPLQFDAGDLVSDLSSGRSSTTLGADRYWSVQADYDRVADMIEPGSKVLVAVDLPSLLVGQGFDVHSLDLLGSTSPVPRLPYFEGAEAKLAWARDQGYDYIVAVDPAESACLYNGTAQQLNVEKGGLAGSWAPWYLDWFDLLAEATATPPPIDARTTRVGALIVMEV